MENTFSTFSVRWVFCMSHPRYFTKFKNCASNWCKLQRSCGNCPASCPRPRASMSSTSGNSRVFICPKLFPIPSISVKLLSIRKESVQELVFAPLWFHHQPPIISFRRSLLHPLPSSSNTFKTLKILNT